MARREEFSPSTAEDTTTRPARAGLAARAAETTLTPETALLTDTGRVSTGGTCWSPGKAEHALVKAIVSGLPSATTCVRVCNKFITSRARARRSRGHSQILSFLTPASCGSAATQQHLVWAMALSQPQRRAAWPHLHAARSTRRAGQGARSSPLRGPVLCESSASRTQASDPLLVAAHSRSAASCSRSSVQTSAPLLAGALAVALVCCPESALALVEEPSLLSDFSVKFLGSSVDHRWIVEAVVLGQTVGFVGSVIAGLQARKTGKQVVALNARLREVNKTLRERARAPTAPPAEDASPLSVELISLLRQGKQLLKLREGAAARDKFQAALALARTVSGDELSEPWKAVRKSLRGLAAASQLLGDTDAALRNMREVLSLSAAAEDTAGQADAMGVIADLHTERGELDEAGLWCVFPPPHRHSVCRLTPRCAALSIRYDKYISLL